MRPSEVRAVRPVRQSILAGLLLLAMAAAAPAQERPEEKNWCQQVQAALESARGWSEAPPARQQVAEAQAALQQLCDQVRAAGVLIEHLQESRRAHEHRYALEVSRLRTAVSQLEAALKQKVGELEALRLKPAPTPATPAAPLTPALPPGPKENSP